MKISREGDGDNGTELGWSKYWQSLAKMVTPRARGVSPSALLTALKQSSWQH